jgi:hypothetical protein
MLHRQRIGRASQGRFEGPSFRLQGADVPACGDAHECVNFPIAADPQLAISLSVRPHCESCPISTNIEAPKRGCHIASVKGPSIGLFARQVKAEAGEMSDDSTIQILGLWDGKTNMCFE